MTKNYLFTAIAGLCLFGCTTSPPSPSATINAEQISYAILSEFYCTVQDLQPIKDPQSGEQFFLNPNDQWILAVELNLSASVEGSVAPSVSLLGPLNPFRAVPTGGTTGSFTTALGASFDQTRTNARDYKIYVDVNHLMGQRDPGEDPTSSPPPPPNWKDWTTKTNSPIGPVTCPYPNGARTYLAGNLGIEEWLTPTFFAQERTRQYSPMPAAVTKPGQQSSLFMRRQVVRRGGTPNRIQLAANPNFTVAQNAAPAAPPSSEFTSDEQKAITDAATKAATDAAVAAVQAAAAGQSSGGGGQSPTIGVTFTFTIKSAGNVGPSFTLTRVSGGSNSLFSLTRTDTNYVNLVLTPASYCPNPTNYTVVGANAACTGQRVAGTNMLLAKDRVTPTPLDLDAAMGRIENTLFTLNLNRALSP
jgi:hypothetical protein